MKYYFVLIAILLSLSPLYSQQNFGVINVDKYTENPVPSDFDSLINTIEKDDFVQLRRYLNIKNDLLNSLNHAKDSLPVNDKLIKFLKDIKSRLPDLSKVEKDTVLLDINTLRDFSGATNLYLAYTYSKDINKVKVAFIDARAKFSQIEFQISEYESISKKRTVLLNNIKVVNDDIYKCTSAIDIALAPAVAQQQFKSKVSIIFVILIGILLIAFFIIVYLRSDNNLAKELLGGSGLQFITLFVLIISIVLFGVLDILKGSELATILSGISGYILGKGIGDKNKENQTNPNP